MALLEVEEVRKRFGGLVAVDGVSFSVEPGKIKALIGPNGAGKTTLFNLVSGLLTPESGCIRFKARDVQGCRPHQIARLGMSRTFQNPSLFGRLNVLENVMVGSQRWARSQFLGSALRLPRHRREERQVREHAQRELQYVGL